MQCKQCKTSNATAMLVVMRRGLSYYFLLNEDALLSGYCVFMWLKRAIQMINPFWVISSVVYVKNITIAKPLYEKVLSCFVCWVGLQRYVGKGRSWREFNRVCVTASSRLLTAHDVGACCSELFCYYFDSFVSPLNLAWIICEVVSQKCIIHSLVQFVTWVAQRSKK